MRNAFLVIFHLCSSKIQLKGLDLWEKFLHWFKERRRRIIVRYLSQIIQQNNKLREHERNLMRTILNGAPLRVASIGGDIP